MVTQNTISETDNFSCDDGLFCYKPSSAPSGDMLMNIPLSDDKSLTLILGEYFSMPVAYLGVFYENDDGFISASDGRCLDAKELGYFIRTFQRAKQKLEKPRF